MTAEEFLSEMAQTANTHNLEAHMNLISKDVKVHGFPEFDLITYDDWFNQCKQEFENMLIVNVSYKDLHTLSETIDEIRFIAVETVEARDRQVNINCIEFIIRKESDEQWRVVHERIISAADLDDSNSLTLQ
jgi:hypothetical protein